MTKKEARAQGEAWKRALAEDRVVNFNNGERLKEYKTPEEACMAVLESLAVGIPAKVVP